VLSGTAAVLAATFFAASLWPDSFSGAANMVAAAVTAAAPRSATPLCGGLPFLPTTVQDMIWGAVQSTWKPPLSPVSL
jgi:hypothetical protein